MAGIGSRFQHPVLDAVAGVSVPRRDHLDSSERRSHLAATGGAAGDLAIDFREVHGALAGTGVCNVLAGVAGTVPNIVSPGIVSYTQVTGVASRRVGYCVGGLFIALAFLPKVSGLLSSLPGPVMAGYLILITGTLFVDGARTVIQTEQDRQKLTVAGVSFWIGAAFQFGLSACQTLARCGERCSRAASLPGASP